MIFTPYSFLKRISQLNKADWPSCIYWYQWWCNFIALTNKSIASYEKSIWDLFIKYYRGVGQNVAYFQGSPSCFCPKDWIARGSLANRQSHSSVDSFRLIAMSTALFTQWFLFILQYSGNDRVAISEQSGTERNLRFGRKIGFLRSNRFTWTKRSKNKWTKWKKINSAFVYLVGSVEIKRCRLLWIFLLCF